jgi:hypothetical protein
MSTEGFGNGASRSPKLYRALLCDVLNEFRRLARGCLKLGDGALDEIPRSCIMHPILEATLHDVKCE